MRLCKLWLGDFYNLSDVEINFDKAPSLYGSISLRFFVGLNGSGKSNALEAIGLIFSHLAADVSPGFDFDIEYELRRQAIRITNRPDQKEHFIKPIEAAVFVAPSPPKRWQDKHRIKAWSTSGDAYIPSRVVGYSTGPISGLQWALARSIEKLVWSDLVDRDSGAQPEGYSDADWAASQASQIDDLRRRRDAYMDNPDTLFLGSDDAMCAALAILVNDGVDDTGVQDFARRRAKILARVGLDADEPLLAFSLRVAGDWDACLTPGRRERLAALLERAVVRMPVDPDVLPGQAPPDIDAPRSFYAVYDTGPSRYDFGPDADLRPTRLAFFEELLSWRRQGALQDIRLVLRKNGIGDALTASTLSDGEFLFLGRFALLLLLRDIPDCLILLDEPETHFNDHWKVTLVEDICDLLAADRRARTTSPQTEVIIATHSDLTLTDADPRQVYLFRDMTDGSTPQRIAVGPPLSSPFAANIQDISRDLFDTEHTIGAYSKARIEEALESDSEAKIERMLRTVGPGFYQFKLREKLFYLTNKK